ncbi:MAG TPA: hypothetical protein VGB52_01765 [Actinomycetota bacterium]
MKGRMKALVLVAAVGLASSSAIADAPCDAETSWGKNGNTNQQEWRTPVIPFMAPEGMAVYMGNRSDGRAFVGSSNSFLYAEFEYEEDDPTQFRTHGYPNPVPPIWYSVSSDGSYCLEY